MKEKTCFVIMPFGDKPDIDGEIIEFDSVYEVILMPAVDKLKDFGFLIKCIRCDKIGQSGWIHSMMIEHILESDIAIVDLTTTNSNVFYELGVRHALRNKVTVLVRKQGTKLPFNIQGLSVIDYDLDWKRIPKAVDEISVCIRKGLESEAADSLVYQVIDDLRVERGSANLNIQKTEQFDYRLKSAENKRISIITGNLRKVSGIDVWVSAENTNMQMARFYDRSISGIVRYYGARRNKAGHVVEDVIANELTAVMDGSFAVPPGHIIVTGSGQLTAKGVKRVLHAAAVEGMVGGGYRPIQEVSQCVSNALEMVDQDLATEGLKSILFPILGTGSGGGDVKLITRDLLLTAIRYFEEHPDSSIDTVFFLAHRQDQLDACQAVLTSCPAIEFIRFVPEVP